MNKAIILLTMLTVHAGSVTAHADYEFTQVPLPQQLEKESLRDLEIVEFPKSEPHSNEYVILVQKEDYWCNSNRKQGSLTEIARNRIKEKIKNTYDECLGYWK